jgi:hypothetical protein
MAFNLNNFNMKSLILLAFLSCSSVFGQQQLVDLKTQQIIQVSKNYALVIEKKDESGEKRYIVDRERIKVFNAAGAHAKGRLQILSPDTVIVGRQKIAFSEITRIHVYSKTFRKIGFIVGGLSGVLCLYILSMAGMGDIGPAIAVLSATTAGFLSLTLISKKYDLGDEYKAYFQKLE